MGESHSMTPAQQMTEDIHRYLDVQTDAGGPTVPTRVLMVTNTWVYGGRERVIKSLCEGFGELPGRDVILVVARRRDVSGTVSPERFPEPQGIPVWWLETDRMRGVVFPLSRMIRKLHPDVVFWHADVHAFPYYWLASALAGYTRRVVPVYHGIAPTSGTSVRSRLGEQLAGMVARMVSASVAVSKGTASAVEKHFRLRRDTVHVIYNPIDAMDVHTKATGHEPEELAGKHPVVLTVARLSPQKDWETLIRAFKIVAAATCATLCIVGEGEEREHIVDLARNAGVADRVTLAGNQHNPYPYMSHADVFVVCSHFEGFPMVLLEAMACGVSIVATDCESGPREAITHGQNGLLVVPEDPAALAEGILAVLTDADLAQRLSKGGLQRAEEFRLCDAVENYRQIAEIVCRRSQYKLAQLGDEEHVRRRWSRAKKK